MNTINSGEADSDTAPRGDDPVTGDLSREHWIVPVHGLTHTDPDGTVQVLARRDGTVILDLTCGDSWTRVWFDVCRAAQFSTGIWEAAGAAQQLAGDFADHQPHHPRRPADRGTCRKPGARTPTGTHQPGVTPRGVGAGSLW